MRSFVTSKNVKWCHLIWPTLYIFLPSRQTQTPITWSKVTAINSELLPASCLSIHAATLITHSTWDRWLWPVYDHDPARTMWWLTINDTVQLAIYVNVYRHRLVRTLQSRNCLIAIYNKTIIGYNTGWQHRSSRVCWRETNEVWYAVNHIVYVTDITDLEVFKKVLF